MLKKSLCIALALLILFALPLFYFVNKFDLIFTTENNWGYRETINTYNNTFTRVNIKTNQTIVIPFTLTDSELTNIKKIITKHNILYQKNLFQHVGLMNQYPQYYLKIQTPFKSREETWGGGKTANNDLKELQLYLYQVIQSKPEYKNIPLI